MPTDDVLKGMPHKKYSKDSNSYRCSAALLRGNRDQCKKSLSVP